MSIHLEAKTANLAPGASETVNISVALKDLTSYDVNANDGKGGYVLDAGNYTYVASRPGFLTTEPIPFTVTQAQINNGDKVVVKIDNYSNKKNPTGQVIEVLGAPNKIETEVKAIIRSYDLYEEFPKKVIEFADTMPDEEKVNLTLWIIDKNR